jgi:hypothetical protein
MSVVHQVSTVIVNSFQIVNHILTTAILIRTDTAHALADVITDVLATDTVDPLVV